ncbi:MAG: sodium:proton antiporter [Proteobacteria bacterium]|nr:sodium:proton antiporter [Pseudomonadota bacterium]
MIKRRRAFERVFDANVALWTILLQKPALAAAPSNAPQVDGAQLGFAWVIPFGGILLSIAVLPLLAPQFWERHFGKVAAFWAMAFLVPFAAFHGPAAALYEFLHTVLVEYLPFVVLLLALFTAASGIHLRGNFVGTPAVNTGLLAAGTAIASWTGTTGACILLIQPLLRANAWRRRYVHIFVFYIFLVGNIGGSLTPLGDPPLFIGFLEGVDFFWVTRRMLAPMLIVGLPLLALFYALDRYFYAGEDQTQRPRTESPEPLGLEGKRNLMILLGIILAVLASGTWTPDIRLTIYYVPIGLESLARTVVLLLLTWLSWRFTDRDVRQRNEFSWHPMLEVLQLFFGIFVTIAPALLIIRAGAGGAAHGIVALLGTGGQPDNVMYFWITGILSSFLDNAPTYLLLFNLAGGDERALMGPLAGTLLAISTGAVFMGAMTYIGNAPNFMVKAIVEARGMTMPGFFGYMGWSCAILLPLFVVVTVIFFL